MKIKKLLFNGAIFGFFIVLAAMVGRWQWLSYESEKSAQLVLSPAMALPDFSLTDQDGSNFTRDALLGHWSLLFFGYTHCPDVCPPTLRELERLMNRQSVNALSSPLQVIFISVDPERDAPRLASYLAQFHQDMVGLHGDHARLGRVFGVYAEPAHSDHQEHALPAGSSAPLINHTQSLFLIDPAGNWRAKQSVSLNSDERLAEWLSLIDRHWPGA